MLVDEPHEVWRPVGVRDAYEASNLGRVRHSASGEPKKPTRTYAGSLVVNLYQRGQSNVRAVHSIVAEAFLGPRPRGFMIHHKDGDKTNCAVSNLAYVPLGLRQPCLPIDQGRYLVGKLNREQAAQIKRRSKAGEAVKSLAIEIGVGPALVSNIKHGKKWKDA